MKKILGIALGILIIVSQTIINCSKSKKKSNYEPGISVNLPYNFKTDKAERLSIKAFDLNKTGNYDEAIRLYRQAIIIEPDNPKLFFDLSDCYFRKDNLEQAIQTIDTAIGLDTSYAFFYNNRGFYFYRMYDDQNALNNFSKAIKLDSVNWVFYANLALVHNSMNNLKEACRAFQISKRLGLNLADLNDQAELWEIEKICELETELLKKNIDADSK